MDGVKSQPKSSVTNGTGTKINHKAVYALV